MKLYFASGTYLAYIDNLRIVKEQTGIDPFPVRILLSYLDVRNKALAKVFERWFQPDEVELFMDSGAFGAYSRRLLLDVRQYGEWLKQNKDWIHIYANLDVKHSAVETAANQKTLEDMGLEPLPVYHASEDFDIWCELSQNYDYICLGGIAGGKLGDRERFITRIKKCLDVSDKDQTKVHLFGVGSSHTLSRVNPYSADSTSFIQSKYGRVVLWDERDLTTRKISLRSAELVKYEHLFSRYGLPTSPIFMKRPGRYGYTVIRAFEYLQFQRMGEWLDAIWKARGKRP